MPKILQSASSTSAGQTSHTAAAEAMTENNSFVRSVMGDISVCPQAKQLLGQIVMDAGERWQHEEGVPAFLSDLLKDEKFVKEIMDLTGLVMAANQPDSAPPASVKDLLAPGCHAAQFQLDQLRQLLTDKLEYSYPMLDEFRSKGHNSKILHLELDSTLLQSLKAQSPDGSGSEAVTEVAEALHKAIASTLAITSADKDVQADVTSLKKALRAQTDALMKAALVLPVASKLLTPVAGKAPDPDPALIKAVAEGLHDAAKATDQAEKAFTEELVRLSPLSEGAGGAKAVAIQAGLVNKKLKLMRENLKTMEQAIQPARSRMGQLAELSKKAFRAVEKATSAESVGTLQKAMGNAWHKSPAFFRDLVRSTANQGMTLPAAIRHVAKLTTSYINKANHAVQDAARWVGDAHLSFEARLEKGAGDAVTQKINSQVRAAYHPLLVAMKKHQNASEKLIAATETLARATLAYDKSPDGVSGLMDEITEGSAAGSALAAAGQHLAGGLTPGGAAKKEKSEAQLREQAQLMFNQQSEALSAARDEVEGCSEELRAVLKETAERYKQHDKQVKKLRTFKAEIDRAERHFRAAAEKMKGAVGNMANTAPGSEGAGLEEYNREIVSSQKASLRAQDSVLELGRAVQKATGKPVDVFSKDARIALHLGQYFAQMKASMQADPGFKPWLFDRMVGEVVNKEIPGHFGKKDDPDGTVMLARVMAAVVAAGNGTLLTPATIEEVMAKYPTAGEYLAKAGRSSMVGRLVYASVDMTVERLTSCLPRNLIPNLSILKAALLPLTFYQAYSSLQHAVMPGQPAPAKEAAVLGASFLTQLTKQVADFVLPHMWKFLASAALTGYSLARDGADKFSYNLMKDLVDNATFAAASRPLSEGIDIVKDAYVENKINALRMAAAGEAVAAAVEEIVVANTAAQQQIDRLSSVVEQGKATLDAADAASVAATDESPPVEEVTGKSRKERSFITRFFERFKDNEPLKVKEKITTPYQVELAVEEYKAAYKGFNDLNGKKSVGGERLNAYNRLNIAIENVETLRNNLRETEIKRSKLDLNRVATETTDFMNSVMRGSKVRDSEGLFPRKFTENYIMEIINRYPKSERGGLDAVDSKITLKSKWLGEEEEFSLLDIAQGKVDITGYRLPHNFVRDRPDFNIEFGKELKLLGDDKFKVPGPALGPTQKSNEHAIYENGTKLGDLAADILKKFESEMDSVRGDPEKISDMENFYKANFKHSASELAKKPDLKDFKIQLEAFIYGKREAEHLKFRTGTLTEVVAVSVGNKILAWDIQGTYKVIENTPGGLSDYDTQKWIVSHMSANNQYAYRIKPGNEYAFRFVNPNHLGSSVFAPSYNVLDGSNKIFSPLKTVLSTDTFKQTFYNTCQRAIDDINSMVKTRNEYLIDDIIDYSFIIGGTVAGIALGGLPLTTVGGCIAQLLFATTSTGVKDLVKYGFKDNAEERQAILDSMTANIAASLIVDGLLICASPKVNQILNSLGIKKVFNGRTLEFIRDSKINVAGFHAANNVASNLPFSTNQDEVEKAELPNGKKIPDAGLTKINSQLAAQSKATGILLDNTYTVLKPADLFSVCADLSITMTEFSKLQYDNSIKDPMNIPAGTKLIIEPNLLRKERLGLINAKDVPGKVTDGKYVIDKETNANAITKSLGLDSRQFGLIYTDNADKIIDPNKIPAGTELTLSDNIQQAYQLYCKGATGRIEDNKYVVYRTTSREAVCKDLNITVAQFHLIVAANPDIIENNEDKILPGTKLNLPDVVLDPFLLASEGQESQLTGNVYKVLKPASQDSICKDIGITYEDFYLIYRANMESLTDVFNIRPETELIIPDNVLEVYQAKLKGETGKVKGSEYHVLRTASKESICKDLEIPPEKFGLILNANRKLIKNTQKIPPGIKLIIPEPILDLIEAKKNGVTGKVRGDVYHVLQSTNQDTICKELGIPSRMFFGIFKENRRVISDPDNIPAETKLTLPADVMQSYRSYLEEQVMMEAVEKGEGVQYKPSREPAPKKVLLPQPVPDKTDNSVGRVEGDQYTLLQESSLDAVFKDLGVTADKGTLIYYANAKKISNPNYISAGTVLTLPQAVLEQVHIHAARVNQAGMEESTSKTASWPQELKESEPLQGSGIDSKAFYAYLHNKVVSSGSQSSKPYSPELYLRVTGDTLKEERFENIRFRRIDIYLDGEDKKPQQHVVVVATDYGKDYVFDVLENKSIPGQNRGVHALENYNESNQHFYSGIVIKTHDFKETTSISQLLIPPAADPQPNDDIDSQRYFSHLTNTVVAKIAKSSPIYTPEIHQQFFADTLKEEEFENVRFRSVKIFKDGVNNSSVDHSVVVANKDGKEYVFDILAHKALPDKISNKALTKSEWDSNYAAKYPGVTIKFKDFEQLPSANAYGKMTS
ncbi:hypothetical protein ACP3TC_01885 [Winslowiella sp. 2C04]|uniref:hypothetical protein n=1 Tax=Winslowiella sp. 2C04 TaxID=3416179 RepID=UPI003CF935F0